MNVLQIGIFREGLMGDVLVGNLGVTWFSMEFVEHVLGELHYKFCAQLFFWSCWPQLFSRSLPKPAAHAHPGRSIIEIRRNQHARSYPAMVAIGESLKT